MVLSTTAPVLLSARPIQHQERIPYNGPPPCNSCIPAASHQCSVLPVTCPFSEIRGPDIVGSCCRDASSDMSRLKPEIFKTCRWPFAPVGPNYVQQGPQDLREARVEALQLRADGQMGAMHWVDMPLSCKPHPCDPAVAALQPPPPPTPRC